MQRSRGAATSALRNSPRALGQAVVGAAGDKRTSLLMSQPRMKNECCALASAVRTAPKKSSPSTRKASRVARSRRQHVSPSSARASRCGVGLWAWASRASAGDAGTHEARRRCSPCRVASVGGRPSACRTNCWPARSYAALPALDVRIGGSDGRARNVSRPIGSSPPDLPVVPLSGHVALPAADRHRPRVPPSVRQAMRAARRALPEKKTVCTITVNSADEKETFRRALGPGQVRIRRARRARSADWLESACRDRRALRHAGHLGPLRRRQRVLLRSRRGAANTFRSTSSSASPAATPARASSRKLKEVYLFGCNTLNSEANTFPSAEIGRSLVRAGFARARPSA